MTTAQRIFLMADLWPKACRAQGWDKNNREVRLQVFSQALKRAIESASEINTKEDFDAVKNHLLMMADNVQATIETDHPEMGRARRLRETIRDQVKCLALYHPNAAGYLAEVIKDKFKHGSRAEPLTIDDLSGAKPGAHRPSQLEQLIMTLARNIQTYRKEAGDSLHEMKTRAGVYCGCAACKRGGQAAGDAWEPEGEAVAVTETEDRPF